MRAGIVSETVLCSGQDGQQAFYFNEHRPGACSGEHHLLVQLSVQDRMHVSGNEASDWCIRLQLLEQINAEAVAASLERRTSSPGASA